MNLISKANSDKKEYERQKKTSGEKGSLLKKEKAILSAKEAQKISKEVSILRLIDETSQAIYGLEVEKESEKTASLFFSGLLFSITVFLVLWFLSFNFSIIGDYLNNIFCRKSSNDS